MRVHKTRLYTIGVLTLIVYISGCGATPEQQRQISEAMQDAGRQMGEAADARRPPVECDTRYGRVTCPR